MFARPIFAVAIVATFASVALSQGCTGTTTLRAIGSNGKPVTDLTAGQLRAEINGRPSEITAFSAESKPMLILMLDASASMRSTWNQAITAAKQIVSRAGDSVEIFVSDESIQDHATGGRATEQLLQRWSKETPRHASAIYDLLLQIAGQVKTHNAAIVVISDADDDASTHSIEATESALRRSAQPAVFGLILDSGRSTKQWKNLKNLADSTGGFVVHPPSSSAIPESTDQLALIALNPFSLAVRLSEPVSPGARLKVEVSGKKDIHLVYRGYLDGCDNQSPSD